MELSTIIINYEKAANQLGFLASSITLQMKVQISEWNRGSPMGDGALFARNSGETILPIVQSNSILSPWHLHGRPVSESSEVRRASYKMLSSTKRHYPAISGNKRQYPSLSVIKR